MQKIFNGTPHPITIIEAASTSYNEALRKATSEAPTVLREVPSTGVLSAHREEHPAGDIDGIPVSRATYRRVDPLPEGYDAYIVSALYASAAKELGYPTERLYTVSQPVYSPDGRTILGCLGLTAF
jgi:hypothetical protein